jgi:adenylate kinase family enzyme
MGDVFRELATQNTDLGSRSRRLFEEHKYSDIELFREAFLWRMRREDVSNGFILDGGFRFTDEVKEFDRLLEEAKRQMPVTVVYLRIPIWGGFERLKARGRNDDTNEGIRLRLGHHYNHLGERTSLAGKKWPFFIINAWGKSEKDLNVAILNKIEEVRKDEGNRNQ